MDSSIKHTHIHSLAAATHYSHWMRSNHHSRHNTGQPHLHCSTVRANGLNVCFVSAHTFETLQKHVLGHVLPKERKKGVDGRRVGRDTNQSIHFDDQDGAGWSRCKECASTGSAAQRSHRRASERTNRRCDKALRGDCRREGVVVHFLAVCEAQSEQRRPGEWPIAGKHDGVHRLLLRTDLRGESFR